MKKRQIGVIGSAGPEEYPYEQPEKDMFMAAEEIGELLARNECIVVNGGKGGVMEAVCRGAKREGGITVAEVAGLGRGESNDYVDIEMVTTDVGFRGPSALVGMCDAIISIGGGAGTLQEIAVAYRMGLPIILVTGYGGWTDKLTGEFLDERRTVRFDRTDSINEAVSLALGYASDRLKRLTLPITDKDDRI